MQGCSHAPCRRSGQNNRDLLCAGDSHSCAACAHCTCRWWYFCGLRLHGLRWIAPCDRGKPGIAGDCRHMLEEMVTLLSMRTGCWLLTLAQEDVQRYAKSSFFLDFSIWTHFNQTREWLTLNAKTGLLQTTPPSSCHVHLHSTSD